MSTRGFIGFVADGKTKVAYNHSDSYPEGLGMDVLHWLRSAPLDDAAEAAKALRVIEGDEEPTDADVDALKAFYDPSVGGRSERPTWYQLLRRTQGDPALMLQAGVVEDASSFPADSLYAEYGYIADFDARTFEAYVGFQTAPHSEGRFANLPKESYSNLGSDYYPVRLAASWPMAELPTNEQFEAAFADDEDDV